MARDILGDTIGSSVASGGSGRSPLTASSSDLNAGAPEFVPRSAAFQNHRVIKIHQHPPHQLAPPPVIPVFHMSPVGNPSAFLAPMLGHRAFGYYGGGGSGKFGDTEVKSVGGAGFGYAGQGRALGGRYPQDKQAAACFHWSMKLWTMRKKQSGQVIELNDGKNWSGLRVHLLLRCLKPEPGRGRKSGQGHESNYIVNEDDIATTNQPFETENSSQSSRAFVEHLGEESFNDKEVRMRHGKGWGRGGQGIGRRHHSTDHHDGGQTADNSPPHHQVHAEQPAVTKLPPGPRMPDGTKGFTMGCGKPLNPMQID